MSFVDTGKVWTHETFAKHVRGVNLGWAKGITIHHTAAPSLEQRPSGLKAQHIVNIRDYYQRKLGWSRGPHLFTDEDQCFGMSPISARGVHARSFNRTHIGIEVLGNYDKEDPKTGRGLKCWSFTAGIVAILLARMGKGVEVINFHRDDPKTSKSCPGTLVQKDWFRMLVQESDQSGDSDQIDRQDDDFDQESARKILANIEWQIDKMKQLL